jgi:hypothetical protein
MEEEQTVRNTTRSDAEATPEATPSTKNFQDEVRQWFTALSPEDRAAALGFEDKFLMMVARMARIASTTALPSSTASTRNNGKNNSCCDEQGSNPVTISIQEPSPTSLKLPPKPTTDKLFSNGT